MPSPAQVTRFHALRIRLEEHITRSRLRARVWEFLLFVLKQAWACLFGAVLLGAVLLSHLVYPAHAPIRRYDALFLFALTLQILLLLFRLETLREAKIILVFHVIGTAMELFNTSVGSWSYPEPCFFHIGHVPLFSGFMYASLGSYLARATRILHLHYTRYPRQRVTLLLALAIYANFFLHHYMPDLRPLLFLLVLLVFGRTTVFYRPYRRFRRMPLLLGFVLITTFLWTAENIGTFANIWVYPDQQRHWQLVHLSKFGSWFLLMIVSYILVALVHAPRSPLDRLPLPLRRIALHSAS